MSTRRALDELVRGLQGEPVLPAGMPQDWAPTFALANDHLLTPALFGAFGKAGLLSRLPTDAADYLATLHRLNARRNRALRRQAIELIGALNRRGLTPILLKGGLALFDGPYADPAMRMMRDLDVLVPAEALDRAVMVLGDLGYRLSRPYPEGHHAIGDFTRPGDPGSVDLHTELVDPSYLLSAAEMRARAAPKTLDGVRFLAPSPTDRVLHNVLHAQVHFLGNYYRGELQLQQVHELAALAGRFGPAIDWSFIERRLAEHRLETPLQSYLLAAGRLFGLAWPLARPHSLWASLHWQRCRLQLLVPWLRWLGIPWGNVRCAFAWHRMHALYGKGSGDTGGPVRWRTRHLVRYLRKKGAGAVLDRVLREAG